MPHGYNGKILKVDLTTRTWTVDEPAEDFYRTYLGGSALGLAYILREVPPKADPLGPENVLTFAVSVVTGTPFSGQSRISANAKSPLTDAIGDAQAGGFFPAELKAAGYDALVIRGQASAPVYLWIKDGAVEIRDASALWGLTTAETEDRLRAELEDPKIEITEIGPAGERLAKIAAIMNMANRAHGRTGLGAVMGSKRLKAIAVRGTRRPRAADPARLAKIAKWGAENIGQNDSMVGLTRHGTAETVAAQHYVGGLPTRNWRSGVFEDFEPISGEVMTETILKDRDTCYACVTRCKRVVEIVDGPYPVNPRSGGPEYESIATLGSYCGVGDLAAVARANELCNQYGLDTIGTGATIAWAMECFEHGLLTVEDTGGLELRFGDAGLMLELVQQIGEVRDFGALLAEGSAHAARRLGRGTEHFVVAVKNAELPAHMPEVKRSLGLIYAVNPFGADHQSSEHDPAYTAGTPAEQLDRLAQLGLTSPQPTRVLNEEKVRFTWETQKAYSLTDALCLCQFDWGAAWQLYGPDLFAEMVQAVTGWDVTLDELMAVGERRIAMMRQFNAREGFTRADDVLPPRVYEPRVGGPTDGIALDREALEAAKDAYYRLAGWDVATGNPSADGLAALGLGWTVENALAGVE